MKATLLLLLACLLLTAPLYAQIGLGTTTPKAFVHVPGGRTVLFGDDTTYNSGEESKLIWYGSQGAFRVGGVRGSYWNRLGPNDLTNVGKYSFASGSNSKASGDYSTAMGWDAIAGGMAAVSLGVNTKAEGDFSTALGEGTRASQAASLAMGVSTWASAYASTAMGYESVASGEISVSMGYQTRATKNYAVSMGRSTTASEESSTAMGHYTLASGESSTAMGYQTKASGESSLATGDYTLASGNYSTAMGSFAKATGVSSAAVGYSTVAGGYGSMALGGSTTASGDFSTAIGYQTKASGENSTAIGSYVSTNNYKGSIIIGDFMNPSTVYNNSTPNQMMMRFGGGYILYTSSPADFHSASGVELKANANAWSVVSDSTRKENFRYVDGTDFLQKIAQMRLGSWNYKGQDAKTYRHYGPMAQDFFAAFGKDELGVIGEDKSINQADFDGVNLIAIQALIRENQQLKARLATLEQQVVETASLKSDMEQMKRQMAILLKQ